MIFKTILKHKERVTALVPTTSPPVTVLRPMFPNASIPHALGKLEYVKWLEEHNPFKKGDYIVPRGILYPWKKEDVWYVDDISEAHWLCKDNLTGMRPKPLIICNIEGKREFGYPHDYIKCGVVDLHFKEKKC